MITVCDCSPDFALAIVRSNAISVSKCRNCGTFWLSSPVTPEPRPADGDAGALCEVVESLTRLKLPGTLEMRGTGRNVAVNR